jgi:hypothetical protein
MASSFPLILPALALPINIFPDHLTLTSRDSPATGEVPKLLNLNDSMDAKNFSWKSVSNFREVKNGQTIWLFALNSKVW